MLIKPGFSHQCVKITFCMTKLYLYCNDFNDLNCVNIVIVFEVQKIGYIYHTYLKQSKCNKNKKLIIATTCAKHISQILKCIHSN